MKRNRLPLVVAAILSGTVTAQSLTLPAGPVAPGSTVFGTYHNTSAQYASHPLAAAAVSLLHDEGELIQPRSNLPQGTTWSSVPPGGAEPFTLSVPATGPGSSGSFVVLYPWGPSAVGRLDVGAASPSFAAIHAFSRTVHVGYGTHTVAFGSTTEAWLVGNTSAAAFTFAPGDQLAIFAPGGTVPLAVQPLGGIAVPAGRVASVPLPVAALPPGPCTVAMSWLDPLAGPVVRRFGIHAGPYADLFLPAGRVVPFGGSITLFTNCDVVAPTPAAGPMSFVQLADLSTGTTLLPGGQQIPIVADPIAISCVTSSLFGLLINGQGLATAIPLQCSGYCGPISPGWARYQTPVTTLVNPSLPGLSGLVLRVATLLYDTAGGRYIATQGEEIVLG